MPGHDTAHCCRGKYIDSAKQVKKGIRGRAAGKAMNLWSVPEEDGSG
jgi:hypothetical protein